MTKIRNLRSRWVALALAGALGGAGGAWAAGLPALQVQGPVTYLTGGVGATEAKAIESEAAKWPVVLEFAVKDPKAGRDAFLANVGVKVVDAHQAVVLDMRSEGPFVLARLQPGRYEVKATFDGKTISRTIRLAGKTRVREVFTWPHAAEKAAG